MIERQQETERTVRRGAGGVAYRYDIAGAPLILLIHDKYGFWTLPKGHLHDGESEATAAAREVREETGIAGEIGPLVARVDYVVFKKGVAQDKQVAFFLLRAANDNAKPQGDEGISAVGWFAPTEAMLLIGYPQVRQVVAQALRMIPSRAPA